MANSLEYANPVKAWRDHVDDEDKKTFRELTQGVNEKFTPSNQQPHELYKNESGLYNPVLRSNKPGAESFKRWVAQEVLPSLRKHGHASGNAVTALAAQVQALQATVTTLAAGIADQHQLRKVSEHGPRIEMSRAFPSQRARQAACDMLAG